MRFPPYPRSVKNQQLLGDELAMVMQPRTAEFRSCRRNYRFAFHPFWWHKQPLWQNRSSG